MKASQMPSYSTLHQSPTNALHELLTVCTFTRIIFKNTCSS